MNTLALVGDLYGFSGAMLAVFGKIWLSHLVGRKKPLDLPASSDPPDYRASVDRHRSGEHSDIMSFVLVGSGFAFLLLTDLGVESSSIGFFLASLPLMVGILGMGFTTYIAIGGMGYRTDMRRWTMLGATKSSTAIFFLMLTFMALFVPILALVADTSIPPVAVLLEGAIGVGCLVYVLRLIDYRDVSQ